MQNKPKRSESLIRAQNKYNAKIKSVCIHFTTESELQTYSELQQYAIDHHQKVSAAAKEIIKDGLDDKGYF